MKIANAVRIGTLASVLSGCGAADVSIDLPGGYVFFSEAPSMQSVSPANGVATGERYVPCNVNKVCYDKEFIVADQINNGACNLTGSQEYLLAGEKEGETYHWVIVVKERKVLGPFTASEFADVARQRRISRDLKCAIADQ